MGPRLSPRHARDISASISPNPFGTMQNQSPPIPLLAVIVEMRDLILGTPRRSLALLALILLLALTYTLLRPREYVASMVVVPLETSITDATSQLLSSGISLRPQISLGGPPPQMAAFIKVVKSPEAARFLARDDRAVDAILNAPRSFPGRIREFVREMIAGPPLPITPDERVSRVRVWLQDHVTVDQDVDLMAWTINVRDTNAASALYILGQVKKGSEGALRRSAVRQYEVQQQFAMAQIAQTTDATTKQTLYSVLSSITRALLVLRSGSDVAISVVSDPYVPPFPTYPSRFLSLATALIVLLGLALVIVATLAYRAVRCRITGLNKHPQFLT